MLVYRDDFLDIYYPLCYKEIAHFSIGDFEDDFFAEYVETPMFRFNYTTSIIIHNKILPNSNPHYILAFCIYPQIRPFGGGSLPRHCNCTICMLADGSEYDFLSAFKEIKSYTNIDVNRFVNKPIVVLGKLAEQGDVNALMQLARIYKHMREYERQNYSRYNINGDFSVVEKWYKKLALKGHVGAIYWLGLYYSDEKNINHDYRSAVKCFQYIIKQEDPPIKSLYILGELYRDGKGIEQNIEEANRLFKSIEASRSHDGCTIQF